VERFVQDPDVGLMQRVAKEDRAAFEELVLKYQRKVINTIYRYTGNPGVAEELAQDVFVRVFRAAKKYRPEARFSTWLFTIVRNVCANYRTREGKYDRQMDSEASPQLAGPAQQNPEADYLRKEVQQKIQQAIAELPESLRMPLILNHFSQMQYEEIARVLNLSLAAVKVRIHRARMALVEKLSALNPYAEATDD
jgi:RNA polymerase sigma-70 factor (family 1)